MKKIAQCTIKKNCLVLNIFIIKKAAVILNFFLIVNIRHNFLVPRMIESAPKTFMPIQTPDLHGVACITFKELKWMPNNRAETTYVFAEKIWVNGSKEFYRK